MRMTLVTLVLFAAATVPANAQLPSQKADMPPQVTVNRRGSYEVGTWQGEWGSQQQWIAYCHPTISFADAYGIRHYQYNGNPGCEYGLSQR